jgi:hypothetical protein
MFSRFIKRVLTAGLCVGMVGGSLAQLTSNQTGANPGDYIRLDLNLSAARDDNLYLAAILAGTIYFFDEYGNPSAYSAGMPTPRRQAGGRAGLQNVLELMLPEGLDYPVTFYSAFGQGGGDILATPGALDMNSLQSFGMNLTSIPGGPAYAMNCQSCHEYDPAANINNIQAGRDANVIARAIATNKGEMGQLAYLSQRELEAISYWIQNPRFDCH